MPARRARHHATFFRPRGQGSAVEGALSPRWLAGPPCQPLRPHPRAEKLYSAAAAAYLRMPRVSMIAL
jgi:hypothetical protein